MKKSFIILIYLLVSNTLFSQQVKYTRDFGFWGGINVKKKLYKDFEINLEQQLRFYSDAKKFDDYLIDICGKYKMNKNFKLGSNFRYTYNAKRWKEPENNYRYNFALFYRGDIYSRLTFHYRLSYQHEYENLFSEYESTNANHSQIRNRAKVKFKIDKKHRGYFSTELFRRREIFREPYFNNIRFYLGDEINYKSGEFSVSFGYEQEINSTYPLSFFFLKTIYTLKL